MTTFATPPAATIAFVLLNQTADRPDLDPFLPKLRDALQEGLDDFAKFHGGTYTVRVGADPQDRQPGEVAAHIRHNQDGDPQGALAWHQVTNGVEDIELPLDTMSGLTGDSEALDVCADHECKETAGDAGANQWVDDNNGKVSAKEACDRVEDAAYLASNGLHLSNFLLPAAWTPGAPGPYDYMQVLPSQLDSNQAVTMTAGGYDIEATAPSDVGDVQGEKSTLIEKIESVVSRIVHTVGKEFEGGRLKRKSNIYSRTRRRGVRFSD